MPFSKIRADYEARYVSEFVLEKYPNATKKLRCPLGTAPESFIKEFGLRKALNVYRPSRPEVDACVIEGDHIVLIEGKIMKVLDGISKLIVYRDLVQETPELVAYKTLRVDAVLVTPKPPGWTRTVAEKNNISIEIFLPEWLDEYYKKQESYWTSEERLRREERKQNLKRLQYR